MFYYSLLIFSVAIPLRQAQSIKQTLSTVESKVERSVALLASLSSEQTRWEASSESFKVQMATIVGDVLLSSALMAYSGYYDQAMRHCLVASWLATLHAANIRCVKSSALLSVVVVFYWY